MVSKVEQHHRPSADTKQVDFVATSLLALKRGPSLTLSTSSSSASLNSSGTSKEHDAHGSSVTHRDIVM